MVATLYSYLNQIADFTSPPKMSQFSFKKEKSRTKINRKRENFFYNIFSGESNLINNTSLITLLYQSGNQEI